MLMQSFSSVCVCVCVPDMGIYFRLEVSPRPSVAIAKRCLRIPESSVRNLCKSEKKKLCIVNVMQAIQVNVCIIWCAAIPHTHTHTLEDRQAISRIRKTIHGIRTKPRRLDINSPKIDLIGPEQSRAKHLKRCAAFLRLFDTRVIVYLFIFFFFGKHLIYANYTTNWRATKLVLVSRTDPNTAANWFEGSDETKLGNLY